MISFIPFKEAVQKQLGAMSPTGLYTVELDKDVLWNLYLDSFPAGTNNMFRERREYDCNCCKQFIRLLGNVVTIKDGKMVSLWNIKVDDSMPPEFIAVAQALNVFVLQHPIKDVFFHYEKHAGTNKTRDGKQPTIQWDHFYAQLPTDVVKSKDMIPTMLGEIRETKNVFKRSLEELSLEAATSILDLIVENQLYRGAEFKSIIELFVKQKKAYNKLPNDAEKELYAWTESTKIGMAARIRNTVIGTLLSDLSEGMDTEKAVKSFEAKVAPTNYKRPTAIVTQAMLKQAQEKVEELGIEPALHRRYAVATDITINNVLYADRSIRSILGGGVFDGLIAEAKQKAVTSDKAEEVKIDDFLQKVLPKASSIEMLFENKHVNNLVSLIAPVYPDSKNILKWDNNFTWSYNGGVADGIRQQVQARGGRVDGAFRFSHSWNYDKRNTSLMDLHVFLPASTISRIDGCNDEYGNISRVGWNHRNHAITRGVQDVDFTDAAPEGYIPVENITFPELRLMPDGEYVCKIHNWALRHPTNGGFKAEIEFAGQVFEYEYDKPLKNKQWVTVAVVTKKGNQFSIEHKIPCGQAQKDVWGIGTNMFHKVSLAALSPNRWDDNDVGNKHYLFILDKCINEGSTRGFYNEFLSNELTPHRKVFELLSSKLKVPESEQQLSGLGFSSTKRDSVVVRVVTNTGQRLYKLVF